MQGAWLEPHIEEMFYSIYYPILLLYFFPYVSGCLVLFILKFWGQEQLCNIESSWHGCSKGPWILLCVPKLLGRYILVFHSS